jgi:hypothetical protein
MRRNILGISQGAASIVALAATAIIVAVALSAQLPNLYFVQAAGSQEAGKAEKLAGVRLSLVAVLEDGTAIIANDGPDPVTIDKLYTPSGVSQPHIPDNSAAGAEDLLTVRQPAGSARRRSSGRPQGSPQGEAWRADRHINQLCQPDLLDKDNHLVPHNHNLPHNHNNLYHHSDDHRLSDTHCHKPCHTVFHDLYAVHSHLLAGQINTHHHSYNTLHIRYIGVRPILHRLHILHIHMVALSNPDSLLNHSNNHFYRNSTS